MFKKCNTSMYEVVFAVPIKKLIFHFSPTMDTVNKKIGTEVSIYIQRFLEIDVTKAKRKNRDL